MHAGAETAILTIDLGNPLGFGRVHILSGEALGAAVRLHQGLTNLDGRPVRVEIRIPRHIVMLTASFASGLFNPSLQHHRSVSAFRRQYRIVADREATVEIDRALFRWENAQALARDQIPLARLHRWLSRVVGRVTKRPNVSCLDAVQSSVRPDQGQFEAPKRPIP